ncbi:benzoylformate decarboxylase [Haloglycomyces albus]|uniref:benzoylformate decarboxylase n=1 Tax=Haloglycomyces albus TaxID=526067 RepID=UPI00046D6532|nr:benzoylformate decarboxylase [Haloglycomyces albus]
MTEKTTTVQDAVFEVFRAFGIDRVFGNPGSTELSFLQRFPSDLDYVLGLQEAVVVGMADAYAAASGRPAVVNLHTATGVGNGMGAMANARDNKTPMLVIAGQQHREMLVAEPLLANPDAVTLTRPIAKWSHESTRAGDIPIDVARALRAALTPPCGPVFLSTPMDDLGRELSADDLYRLRATLARECRSTPVVADDSLATIAERMDAADQVALVFGGEIDRDDAHSAAVALADSTGAPVWSAPVEGRLCFPNNHPQYQGELEPAIGLIAHVFAEFDLVVVVGAPVFKYYPYVPGPWLANGTDLIQLTSAPNEAVDAVVGSAWVGHVGSALEGLLKKVQHHRTPPEPLPEPVSVSDVDPPLPEAVFDALAASAPANTVWVNESPSNVGQFWQRVRPSEPHSFYFSAGGGLGYGMAAAVGAGMAQPHRPVIAVIGDGSAQYALPAMWTAQRYSIPVVFVVLRNDEYAILKWFAQFENADSVPGLDVGGIETTTIASGYGLATASVRTRDEIIAAVTEALERRGPTLIEVPVTTVTPLLGGDVSHVDR